MTVSNVSLEDLMRRSKSFYGLVLCAAARANELLSGEQPLIQTKSKKVATISLQEIGKGKVYFEVPKLKQAKS